MTQTARRPSVEEIEQLREQTRRAPGSPAFVQLGEAYLALGRPRDAIDVAFQGLQTNPQSIPGRLMLSRAYALLHQWKEAQEELLRVVKADRNHPAGFLLLGEVLLRRGDYQRSLPVLQHAHTLDPGAPGLDNLLRRARTGIPLDPPPPIPTPLEPMPQGQMQGQAHHGHMSQGQGAYSDPLAGFSDEPTRLAPTLLSGGGMSIPPAATPSGPPQGGQGGYPQQVPAYPQAGPAAQQYMPPPAPARPPAPPAMPAGGNQPPPAAAAPAPGQPNVRPRLVPLQKPKDAARAPMRNAAAVGDYLNTLLNNGLLQVPEVQVRVEDFDIKRSKRWGRSTFRMFLFLFILLAGSLGGGGYWYIRTEQQRTADVARHLAEARKGMDITTHAALDDAVASARRAMERDRRNAQAIAVFARANALSALLYGGTPETLQQTSLALETARKDIAEGDEGWGDVLFAQSALTLSRLHQAEEAESQLTDARKNIDAWLQTHGDDHWMRWLQGQAMLAAGDLSAAAEAFEAAEAGGQGSVVATISRANMLLDAGDLTAAEARYEQAFDRIKDHPLALVNEALLNFERSGEPADIKGALSVRLAEESGPRLDAYKALALALVHYLIEDYAQFDENLARATGVPEPRFHARVALAHLLRGNLQAAGEERAAIVWHSKDAAQPHPLVQLFDAELLWLSGLPEQAIEKLGELAGVRAHLVRGRALYDLGKDEEALAELDALLEIAPNDWEGQVWRATVAMVARRKERDAADSALAELGRKHKSKMVRYVHGTAYQHLGRADEARSRFEQSLAGVSESTPNPLAYRAHVALAEMDLADDRASSALEHVEKALEQNPGYLPAAAIKGRIQVAQGQHEAAVTSLAQVIEEPGATASAAVELAYAEALVSRPRADKKARETAREAVRRAQSKGASEEELTRVAPLVDEALLEELGVKTKKRRR